MRPLKKELPPNRTYDSVLHHFEVERKIAARLFKGSPTKRQATEDFLWAILNSYDFLFIH